MEEIPRNFQLRSVEPEFIKWQGDWCLVGPVSTLRLNSKVVVRKRDGTEAHYIVGKRLARRTVHRRPDSHLSRISPGEVVYVIVQIKHITS